MCIVMDFRKTIGGIINKMEMTLSFPRIRVIKTLYINFRKVFCLNLDQCLYWISALKV